MKYYILIYTEKLPEWVGARANGPVIRMRPKYKDDRGILEHEKCHVRQWYMTLGLHGVIKKFSKKYALKIEVDAYRIQLKYSPTDLDWFAKALSERYGLGISVAEAKALLK